MDGVLEEFKELELEMQPFSTTTFGKWILAGEHAVLRGCPALAFPLTSRFLELNYDPNSSNLDVDFRGEHGAELKLLFYGVIENAMSRLQVREPLHGKFVLTNTLPIGAGLGASAALCGAVARWCEAQNWIGAAEVYELACRLEDLFHGESSGVDLAVSLSAQGIRFTRGGGREPLILKWWPKLYLSYSGQRGMTAECVAKVKRIFVDDPERARELDQQMRQAVDLASSALAKPSAEEGMAELKAALDLGQDCFERWDLCGGDLANHIRNLRAAGAWAIKTTGSGGGGYVISLWREAPPNHLIDRLVALNSSQF